MTPPAHLDPANISECEKLSSSSSDMGAIRTFVEWMAEKGFSFGKGHEHVDSCREKHSHKKHGWDCDLGIIAGVKCSKKTTCVCGWKEDQHESCRTNTENLLMEFFDIDPKKLEDERRALLDQQRKSNTRAKSGLKTKR